MSNYVIALLAEDLTDCATVKKIIHRVLGSHTKTKPWGADGGGNLQNQRKLAAKIKSLSKQGCNVFIIINDLDRDPQTKALKDEAALRNKLEVAASEFQDINKYICIPIEEIEAWFWSDSNIVSRITQGRGKVSANPEQIEKPKDKFIAQSIEGNKKPRYSTNMNPKLAKTLDLERCSACCPSFKYFLKFLKSLSNN